MSTKCLVASVPLLLHLSLQHPRCCVRWSCPHLQSCLEWKFQAPSDQGITRNCWGMKYCKSNHKDGTVMVQLWRNTRFSALKKQTRFCMGHLQAQYCQNLKLKFCKRSCSQSRPKSKERERNIADSMRSTHGAIWPDPWRFEFTVGQHAQQLLHLELAKRTS